jgi:release factor glutamine methyltransferase
VTAGLSYRRAVERLTRAGLETPLLDAACLLEAASGLPRWRFILEPDRPIQLDRAHALESMLSRREAGEPVAYILGTKEFWSLPLAVDRGVLIPRPDTETVVGTALGKIGSRVAAHGLGDSAANGRRNGHPRRPTALRILDLGTGSGAIALALATEIRDARVWAVDRSLEALRTARRNTERLQLSDRVHFVAGDLFGALRSSGSVGGFDLIVSNPPYVPTAALASLPVEITGYEPLEALDGGCDGLRHHRRIIQSAPAHLQDGGWLVLEVGDGQWEAVSRLLEGTGAFGQVEVARDLAGRERVVAAPRRGRRDG